ncbi:glycosyltransferase family 117 protein [Sphingobacterium bovistauri]|uniref:DUF2723 domain-containing protein n=1 Tax=Sphingobacterium bovistauri TaxID=2781959 RepID=A0ABS7Z2G3_9SPHI|nr:DUF2723 domain-containing protein [Sphingobacterium bovistauri]MCA5004373.1 DUF2723 domain-containing protein [Sphingobacterium bovistauri]
MNYNKINNLLGWLCGMIATIVYIITTDRFNSWWDTGEFVASAYKLQVVHQPGAPLFLMIQNLFSNLAMGDVSKIAFWMNVGSAVCSGVTITFLFWTITALARKILIKESIVDSFDLLKIFGAGIVGSLAYAFTDSFWYSAVESEVYAMSSLCTAVVFWLILKWERRADQADSNKWLLVIAFVMGLSIGVHLLNLLTIPALALVVYFKKAQKITVKGVLKTLGIGVGVLAFILWGVIQYSVKLAAYFDLFFVNNLGLSFGSGILFFIVLLIATLAYGLYYAWKRNKGVLQLAVLSLCFVLFGFSSYTMILIRSQSNISLNNNSPDNAFSFLGYLSREQYASEPLIKGPVYSSKVISAEENYTYRKDDKGYTKIDAPPTYTYDKEMLFPRVWSADKGHFYSYYTGLGQGENPTMWDNLKFFFTYQVNHMYVRYFLWNFVGRQNDEPSHGSTIHGNWISGISAIDNQRLGDESSNSSNDPTQNMYYFLPLLLGIVGLVWQYKRNKRDALIVGLLFFFTGLAIVIYLNQTPMQPRERDYAYSGSFYMFSVWIGLSTIAILDILRRVYANKIVATTALFFVFAAGPGILIYQNWDDHDRSDRTWTRDMAYNYLQSCEPDAILFTYADNDTFPLWYLQEVEGIRTDVRIVNLSYLQSDWYVKQAMHDINQANAAPIQIDSEKIKKGVRDVIHYYDMQVEGHVDLDTLMEIMLSDNPNNQMQMSNGTYANVLPTKQIQMVIDKDSVLRNRVVPKSWEENITYVMQWTYNKPYVTKAELSMLSIILNNNWERPIYFANMLGADNFIGLDKYLVNEGLVYRLMPIEKGQAQDEISLINTDTLYRNITTKYAYGSISTMKHFDVDYRRFVQSYLFDKTINMALDTLIKEEKMNEAKEIALLTVREMPSRVINIQQVYSNAVVVDTLIKVGERKYAEKLAKRDIAYIDKHLNYLSAKVDKLTAFDRFELETTVDSLNRYKVISLALDNKQLITQVQRMEDRYLSN